MASGARFGRFLVLALLAYFVVLIFAKASDPPAGEALPPEAAAARKEAQEILSLPIFRHGVDLSLMERVGRFVVGLLRKALAAIQRVVEFKYGTALATTVSVLVLGAIGYLLWRLRRRKPDRIHAEEARLEGTPAAESRRFLPLGEAEAAFGRGDLQCAAALLTDWFLHKAFEPETPPEWRTNRELLPDLRARGPLRPRDWEALVTFHEALRYAGVPPDVRTVGAWLERARGGAP